MGSDGAGDRHSLGLGTLNAAAGGAKRACVLSARSLRSLAFQSAGRLGALFLNQRPWRSVGWVGGGCCRLDEQKGGLIIPVMWRFRMGSPLLSFHSFMSLPAVTKPLLPARPWASCGDPHVSTKYPALPCLEPGLQPSGAGPEVERTEPAASPPGSALRSAASLLGDSGQETFSVPQRSHL